LDKSYYTLTIKLKSKGTVNSVLFYAGSSKEFALGKLNVKKNAI